MMENLINDLMDHAKMDNNSFNFDNENFSLSKCIYESFNMLNFSAKERDVELRAKIDSEISLKFIQAMYGDKRRFI